MCLHEEPVIVYSRATFRFCKWAEAHAHTDTPVDQPPYPVTGAGKRLCLGEFSLLVLIQKHTAVLVGLLQVQGSPSADGGYDEG